MFCLISYFDFFLYFDVEWKIQEVNKSQGKEKDNNNCLEMRRDAEVNLIFV